MKKLFCYGKKYYAADSLDEVIRKIAGEIPNCPEDFGHQIKSEIFEVDPMRAIAELTNRFNELLTAITGVK